MIILAVDYGKARTGIAVCDEGEILASPVSVIKEWNFDRLCEKINVETKKRAAKLIVVGLPKNMDGTEGESAKNARALGEALSEISGLPVDLWDERGTTITAHGYMNESNVRGVKRKNVIDAVAATVILQSYLDKRRLNKAQNGGI